MEVPRGEGGNIMDLEDLGPDMPVTFPRGSAISTGGGLTSVQPNRLYVTKARNQFAFDSFIQLGTILYFFRFTTANSHDFKKGIEESFLEHLRLNTPPPKENWRFVFVIPPNCEVDVKATSEVEEFLEGVRIYTAHLEIEE